MTKGRLEAFSDAVIAIIMTIMVLELRPPAEATLAALAPLGPVFLCYVLSFVFLGIYWNNHHLIQSVKHINGAVLWANQHLLFWLTLVPFVTIWMGRERFSSVTVMAYGVVLLGSAIAYTILTICLIRVKDQTPTVAIALGRDYKGKVSVVTYLIGIALSYVSPVASCGLYALVAILWLVPDRRFERTD